MQRELSWCYFNLLTSLNSCEIFVLLFVLHWEAKLFLAKKGEKEIQKN